MKISSQITQFGKMPVEKSMNWLHDKTKLYILLKKYENRDGKNYILCRMLGYA